MRINRRNNYNILDYTDVLINKYKSEDNMLKHARYIPNRTKGFFVTDKRNDELVGYIAWENDFITSFETSSNFMRRGVGSFILGLALENGVNKLSVNKKNKSAIEFYLKRGWKVYGTTGDMWLMKFDIN